MEISPYYQVNIIYIIGSNDISAFSYHEYVYKELGWDWDLLAASFLWLGGEIISGNNNIFATLYP